MIRQRPKAGFTLIELLLVVAILSVVSLAMYAVLNNGLKIWQRINKQLPQEDAVIFSERFSRDLENSFKSASIKFTGRKEALEFATVVNSRSLQKNTIGRVAYFYDSQSAALNRKADDYSQIYTGVDNGYSRSLANIKSLRFWYYVFDELTKEAFWQDEWAKETLPFAVKMEFEIGDGSQIRKITQTVGIPAAG